jgi:hypothetical protein
MAMVQHLSRKVYETMICSLDNKAQTAGRLLRSGVQYIIRAIVSVHFYRSRKKFV